MDPQSSLRIDEAQSSERTLSDAPVASRALVASYCTTFLKPEMAHIYRQIANLRTFDTFVITKERECTGEFSFNELEVLPKAPFNPIRYLWLKYIHREPSLVYRGEYDMLAAVCNRRQPDLMHVYFGHTGVHLLPFIQRWSRPTVVSFHGMDVQPRAEHPVYAEKLRTLLRLVPMVLVRSESLKQCLIKLGCDSTRIRINRTGIPLDSFPFVKRTPPTDGGWRFVQACRLVEKKGIDVALTAFAKFHKKHPASRYTIAGEGPLRQKLEALTHSLGIADAVVFAGFLAEDKLNALYARSHLFVHPSQITADQNQEGIPNSMLEAMSTGLPVAATRHGGIPEAVRNGVTGLLSPERDAEALFNNMSKILADPVQWETMGRDASNDTRTNFEQHAQVARLESCYRDLLDTHG